MLTTHKRNAIGQSNSVKTLVYFKLMAPSIVAVNISKSRVYLNAQYQKLSRNTALFRGIMTEGFLSDGILSNGASARAIYIDFVWSGLERYRRPNDVSDGRQSVDLRHCLTANSDPHPLYIHGFPAAEVAPHDKA